MPVLLCTTKYYSSTTLYYKVLLQYYKVLRQYYSVLQSTTPVLLCTTKYYSSETLYYKVLRQYYSVLQSTMPVLVQYYEVLVQYYKVLRSTTPVLLCTTKFYSSTTLYYKVLLQYYSVLRSTTPVLLCTRKYYNVLLQYYSVLQSTTPVPLCTTKYYASTTLYYASTTTYYSGTTLKRHLQCAAQQESASNFTNYCACHAKWMSSMICVTYETSFPMRGASQVTLQTHQILRLPRKMNVINDLRHIWNRISNAWSKWSHPPTSPNTAPATQNECHQWSASHMKPHFQCVEQVKSPSNLTKYCACHAKWMSSMICVTYETSFPMRGASKVTLQPHQILRLPRNAVMICSSRFHRKHPWMLPPIERRNSRISEWIIRRYPRIKSSSRTRRFGDLPDPILETLFYCKIQHFALRLSPKMSRSAAPVTKSPTRQLHQILRLPHKMNVINDLHHIWNVISNARSKYS